MILRRWRPHVLHAHMVHANLLARVSRLIVPTRVVISTMHNQDEGAQWRYVAYRLTDRLSSTSTAVSSLAVEEAVRRRAAPRDRILYVPNGIDLSGYQRDEQVRANARVGLGLGDEFCWLAVGRLFEQKDYPTMLTAFQGLIGRRPGARLLVAGEGPLKADLQATTRALGLEGRVALLGHRSDVRALMQAGDALVLSSRWEGLPMVLLEASASSLPIVATDVAGSRDVILDGVSGLVVPAADPPSLAAAMERMMALSPDVLRTMGEAGRAHVSATFDLEAVTDTWERLYLSHLQPAGRSA
jgi:glycosyltransferase involved in cell wall biosynthesis